MRLEVTYKNNGGGFAVQADDEETLELLLNTALRVLWPNQSNALSLDDMANWLGWEKK